ncbi:murein DD-endopeptidase MepM/ murein hydrolase activator NlpD [Flavobacterium sp. 28YEA47A]|uniref:M23 family metallopeptidase n=1 Tax=Flavobacterium sp. 28YEA47A TaxID=3156276 RepID=UPI003516AD2F
MTKNFIIIALVMSVLYACNSVKLPLAKFNASPLGYSQKVVGDSLVITLDNLLKCPVRIVLNDTLLNKRFESKGMVVLNPSEKKRVSVFLSEAKQYNSGANYMLGNAMSFPKETRLTLPFQKGKKYKVIQGHNGSFSHKDGLSKLALDFDLKTGDTICAAADGFVVGLVDKYKHHGKDSSWKNYANFITLYHPETGLFTEYIHLKEKGALVTIGDFVKAGQPIALCGMTGWTTMAHLHFVAYFRNTSWKSEPVNVNFIEGYKAEELKNGDVVKSNSL